MSKSPARERQAGSSVLRIAALGIALFCAQNTQAEADPVFRAPLRFDVGCANFPAGAVVADFNRDGNPDLAVACIDSRLVIHLGDGRGGLQASQKLGLPDSPWSIVTGQFNNDGAPDLACSLASTDQVLTLLNDGTGRFGASTQYPVGDGPTRIAAGDVDGDGAPDLVTNSASNALFVQRGDGNGGFGAASAIPTGSAPAAMPVLADLDEDGDLDIAASRFSANDVLVLTNDGHGGFAQGGTFAAGTGPSRNVAADLNGDGHLDFAAATSTSAVSVLIGDGGGHFAAPRLLPVGLSPQWLLAADLSGDGRAGLAVAGNDRVTLLLQDATGELQVGQLIPRGFSYFLTGADFDLDGRFDLAAGSQSSFAVHPGEGRGYLLDAPHGAAGSLPGALVSADFNQDGHRDAVVSNRSSGMLSILLGAGNGNFAQGTPIVVPYFGPPGGTSLPSVVAARDFNEDGRPDLAVVSEFGGSTLVYLGDGRGGVTLRQQLPGRPPLIADFNEDGHVDLALPCTIGGAFGTCLNPGNGLGDFGPSQPYITGFFPGATADLNGDSHLDLISWFERPTDPVFFHDFVYVLLGDGSGTFQRMPGDYEVGNLPRGFAIGDLDGDGHLDLAVASGGSSSADPNLISLLFGDGLGSFTAIHLETGRDFAGSLTLADLDMDGGLEVVATSGSDPFIFKKTGQRNFQNARSYSCGNLAGGMVVGDYDDDGRPDLLTSVDAVNSVCFAANRTPLASVVTACADGLDNDADSLVDFPADPGCSDPWDAPEADRLLVGFTGAGLQWDRWRSDLRFDVVWGSLVGLKNSRGDYSVATLGCAIDDAEAPLLNNGMPPPSGDGYWFLVRAETSAGNGSYDGGEPGQQGLRDAEINASALACP